MKICHEESSPRCLVYREPPRPWLGAAITALGTVVGVAAAAFVAMREIDGLSLFAALVGLVVLVLSPTIAIGTMSDYRLLLDKEDRQIVESQTFFSRSSTTRQPLGAPTRVAWTVEGRSHSTGMGTTTSHSYPVKLLYESGGYPARKLFTANSPDKARRLTREVAEYLGIEQSHWDDDHPFLARLHADGS